MCLHAPTPKIGRIPGTKPMAEGSALCRPDAPREVDLHQRPGYACPGTVVDPASARGIRAPTAVTTQRGRAGVAAHPSPSGGDPGVDARRRVRGRGDRPDASPEHSGNPSISDRCAQADGLSGGRAIWVMQSSQRRESRDGTGKVRALPRSQQWQEVASLRPLYALFSPHGSLMDPEHWGLNAVGSEHLLKRFYDIFNRRKLLLYLGRPSISPPMTLPISSMCYAVTTSGNLFKLPYSGRVGNSSSTVYFPGPLLYPNSRQEDSDVARGSAARLFNVLLDNGTDAPPPALVFSLNLDPVPNGETNVLHARGDFSCLEDIANKLHHLICHVGFKCRTARY